jgi:excisionase family DNA binding protein
MRRDPKAANDAATAGGDLVGEGLVSVAEACAFLGVSRSTCYVLMDDGELPYCKIRGARRVPRKALVALAEKSLVESA